MLTVPTEAPISREEKLKMLAGSVTKTLDKAHGAGTLVRLGGREIRQIPCYPTGQAEIDYEVLGCGGIPKGRIIEIFGPESAGKTTETLQFIASVQQGGGVAAFVDAEHALDLGWAKKLGVDVDNLFVNQPDYAEQALQVVEELVDSRCVDLIVLDSVAALVAKAELEGDMGDAHVGLIARLMGQALRKLAGKCEKYGVTIIFINQIREKIGVMYGNPETTPGGRALKFYASVRLDIRRKEPIKKGDLVIGGTLKVKAVKNKCGIPFREGFIDLYFDEANSPIGIGFDTLGSLVGLAIKRGVIAQAGATYSFKGERIAIGKDKVTEALRANDELRKAVDVALKEHIEAARTQRGTPTT